MGDLFNKLKRSKNIIEVPWEVWTKFGHNARFIEVVGENAFLTSDPNSDSGTIVELRQAIEWYVTQLGGKVKWEKV